MAREAGSPWISEEVFTQWRVQEDAAVEEAERLREALGRRAEGREQNVAAIEAKLLGEMPSRRRARLELERDFLKTYNERHPVGEDAVDKHIWIKYGLNYREVMRQRVFRQTFPQ